MVWRQIIKWIVGGWRLFIGHPALWVLVAVYFIIFLADRAIARVSFGFEFLFSIIVTMTIAAGMYAIILHLLRTGKFSFWLLLRGFARLGQILLANVLILLLMFAFALLVGIPIVIIFRALNLHHFPMMRFAALFFSIILGGLILTLYIFIFPLIVDKEMRSWRAMEESRKRAQSNFFVLYLLNLIILFMSTGGNIILNPSYKMGNIVTIPALAAFIWSGFAVVLMICITAVVYREFWPDDEPERIISAAPPAPEA